MSDLQTKASSFTGSAHLMTGSFMVVRIYDINGRGTLQPIKYSAIINGRASTIPPAIT